MEKEDLIQVIYNHDESLKRSIEQVKKDIEYQQDLLKLNEKHNKNTGGVQSKLDELRELREKLNISVSGLENIKENEAAILVSNHSCLMDIFYVPCVIDKDIIKSYENNRIIRNSIIFN